MNGPGCSVSRQFRCAGLALAMAGALVACDPSAKVSGDTAGSAAPASSHLMETCSATSDCQEGLRCYRGSCQVMIRSRLGDYYAAVGRRALSQGAISEAVQAYAEALAEYQKAGIDPSAEITCAQGRALTAARMDPQKAEAAARVLHRCLLEVPPGSGEYNAAMDDLAVLGEVGLEPTLLSRNEPADLYMTRPPKRPSADSLNLKAVGDARSKRKSYTQFLEHLSSDEAKARFAPCWEAHWKATRKENLAVTLPFRYELRLDEDDEALDRAVLKVSGHVEPEDPAQASVSECMKSAASELASELAKGLREDTVWSANVTISLGS